jgi:hypothetical protein
MRLLLAMLLALSILPPPPQPTRTLAITLPATLATFQPAWVVLRAEGLRIHDALPPPGNGFCAYGGATAWCEVALPATITLEVTPQAAGCAAGVSLEVDKRLQGWAPFETCRTHLPAVLQ